MYNWSYINSLRENYPSDDNYQNILRNPRLLYKLEKEYLAKYSMDADVYYLALKESLDHYVAMRIAKDKSFTETEEFKNYAQYLKRLVINILRSFRHRLFLVTSQKTSSAILSLILKLCV